MKLKCSKEILQDAINIYHGVYYPLTGFLGSADYRSVLDKKRLAGGEVWSLPIVLDVDEQTAKSLKGLDRLVISDGEREAVLVGLEIYSFSKEEYAQKVYQTLDLRHPGVAEAMKMGECLVGGRVEYILENSKKFVDLNLTPGQVREVFANKGWRTIVAFQTRNVPHKSHEFLQTEAGKETDGLFIQPVIGKKKPGDFKDEVIIGAYQKILASHLSGDKAFLGLLPITMRYAGPREAVFHALIRRNFGCTRMIIGRDHAGVGSYYKPYEAHDIFNEFKKDELGIEIVKYGNAHYCRLCGGIVFEDQCRHDDEDKVILSGTKIRELIKNKQKLPVEIIRPEISELLLNYEDPFVGEENE